MLLPALAFGGAAAWEALRRLDETAEARLLDTARALAAAVDAQIAAHVAALRVLAATPDADPTSDPEHFRAHAETTAAIFGTWVVASRRDASNIVNTRLPRGVPPFGPPGDDGPGSIALPVRRAFDEARPVVADIAQGRAAGRPISSVFVPVIRDGEVRSVIGMPLLPEQLSDTLAGQGAAGRGTAALTDAEGVFAARSRNPDQVVGRQRPLREDGPLGASGVLRGRSVEDGGPLRTAYHALSQAPGWHVWVNEPEATFAAARRLPLLALAGGAALALGIGLAGAALVTRRLLRPVDALVAQAEAVAFGTLLDGPVPASPAPTVAEFHRLRQAMEGAEAALRRVQRIGRVGGFTIDLSTGENRRSPEYMALQGGLPEAQRERHEDWVRRLHPDDRERAERRFFEAIADGAREADYEQEYRIIRPDGEVCWIYARAEIERDTTGHALRMVGAHVDVTALKAAEAALRHSEERLRLAMEAAQLGAWEVDLHSGGTVSTPRVLEIFGLAAKEAPYSAWYERVDPLHRPRLAERMEAVRSGRSQGYPVEYRFLRPDGRWIWVESHALAAGHDPLTGLPSRMIDTCRDITERHEAEERQAVLVHELDHRAKNTLAVVQAALRLTPRGDAAAYARAIEGRVGALARAHTLLAKARWIGAELRVVAEDALAPFLGGTGDGPTASFAGPPQSLSPGAVQALSMALHELATNAAKHGALSMPSGRVEVRWEVSGEALHLTWREIGGPDIAAPPAASGFGSSLITATIVRQLGGRVVPMWRPAGLLWEAWLPLERLRSGPDASDAIPRVTTAHGPAEALSR
jgi:PAS domain S-box-containing protein